MKKVKKKQKVPKKQSKEIELEPSKQQNRNKSNNSKKKQKQISIKKAIEKKKSDVQPMNFEDIELNSIETTEQISTKLKKQSTKARIKKYKYINIDENNNQAEQNDKKNKITRKQEDYQFLQRQLRNKNKINFQGEITEKEVQRRKLTQHIFD